MRRLCIYGGLVLIVGVGSSMQGKFETQIDDPKHLDFALMVDLLKKAAAKRK